MGIPKLEEIRESVRIRYGEVAKKPKAGCGCSPETTCCGQQNLPFANLTELIGYSKEEIESAPEGADMGLGCGNPQVIARLSPGETVLDLGSGGGFDCFIAARKVGGSGRVIGVDMTPEMVGQARKNAEKAGTENVEFSVYLSEINSRVKSMSSSWIRWSMIKMYPFSCANSFEISVSSFRF